MKKLVALLTAVSLCVTSSNAPGYAASNTTNNALSNATSTIRVEGDHITVGQTEISFASLGIGAVGIISAIVGIVLAVVGTGKPLSAQQANSTDDYASRVARAKSIVRAGGKASISGWVAPEGVELVTPTFDGRGTATHPSVLYFEDGWNGWKYWMAVTPYPGNHNEEPSILVSNDVASWRVPSGLKNPLDDAPGGAKGYNSDAQLVMGPDDTMYLTFRLVDVPNNNINRIFLMKSTDGVHWSPKQEIFTNDEAATGFTHFLSQSLVFLGDRWRLYGVQLLPEENKLVYVESSSADLDTATWSDYEEVDIDYSLWPKKEIWHSEIKLVDGTFYGLIQDARPATSYDSDLFLMRSTDGKQWEVSQVPVVGRSGLGYNSLYKSSFVVKDPDLGEDLAFDIFYTGYVHHSTPTILPGLDQYWNIHYTTANYVGA